MDASTANSWLSEMMEFLDDPIPEITPNFSSETNHSTISSFHTAPNQFSQIKIEKPPAKQQKTSHCNSNENKRLAPKSSSSSSSNIISFGSHANAAKSKQEPVSPSEMNFLYDYGSEFSEERHKFSMGRTPLQAKDHVIAERKRREKLGQMFISLSALLPGLKKLDKASVLGGAIKYIKQLQEDVKMHEEEARKKPVESVVIHGSQSWVDDTSSSDESFNNCSFAQPDREVEVTVSERNVLIKIHCEKLKGIMGKIFSEIERFHLTIINSSIMPFGHTTLAISIIAQMDGQFSMTTKDLANSLKSAIDLSYLM